MKRAICLGIDDYPGSANDLEKCVKDAHDWCRKLMDWGFDETTTILNDSVKRSVVLEELEKLLSRSQSGDVVVMTYSGHGTSVVDNDADETDGYDEALYLYDGVLRDDELRKVLDRTPEGVHVVVILDSCFSGTATRVCGDPSRKYRYVRTDLRSVGIPRRRRLLESEMVEVLMTACSDTEYAYEGAENGAFTGAALGLLDPNVDRTYAGFYTQLLRLLPSSAYPQTPQLEGSAENKARLMFEGYEEPSTTWSVSPSPSQEPEPEPEEPLFSKYWWVAAAFIALIFLLVIFGKAHGADVATDSVTICIRVIDPTPDAIVIEEESTSEVTMEPYDGTWEELPEELKDIIVWFPEQSDEGR